MRLIIAKIKKLGSPLDFQCYSSANAHFIIYIYSFAYLCMFLILQLSIDRNWTYPAGLVALKFLVACCHYWQSISTGSKLAVNWQLQNDPRRFDANCNKCRESPSQPMLPDFNDLNRDFWYKQQPLNIVWTYHIKLYIYIHITLQASHCNFNRYVNIDMYT